MNNEEKYRKLFENIFQKDEAHKKEIEKIINLFKVHPKFVKEMEDDYEMECQMLSAITTRTLSESNFSEFKECYRNGLCYYISLDIWKQFVPFASILSIITIRSIALHDKTTIYKLGDNLIIEDIEEIFNILSLLPRNKYKSILLSLKDCNNISNAAIEDICLDIENNNFDAFKGKIADFDIDFYDMSKMCHYYKYIAMAYQLNIRCAQQYHTMSENDYIESHKEAVVVTFNLISLLDSLDYDTGNSGLTLKMLDNIGPVINMDSNDCIASIKSKIKYITQELDFYRNNKKYYSSTDTNILDSIAAKIDIEYWKFLVGYYEDEKQLKDSYYYGKHHFCKSENITEKQIVKLYKYLTQGEHFTHGNDQLNAIDQACRLVDFKYIFGYEGNIQRFDYNKIKWQLKSQNGNIHKQSIFEFLLLMGYSLKEITNEGIVFREDGKQENLFSVLQHCFDGPITNANYPNKTGSEYRQALADALKACGIEPCDKHLNDLPEKTNKR